MFIVVISSIIALILTFLESKRILPNGMKLGFILITFLACIHYDYGNDYMAYYDIYKDIVKINFSLSDIISGETYKEPGWPLLCYFFKPLGGFFTMVAALNVLQNIIVYKVIKSNVEQSWWTLAVFIYLFSTNFYLLNFSMMRQGLVICVFLGVWRYIKEKKVLLALIIILLCSMIHKSALVLLPFSFAGLFNINKGRIAVIIYIALYFLIWFAGDFMNDVLMFFLSFDEFEEYAISYGNDTSSNTYRLGFILNLIPLILSLIYLLKVTKSNDSHSKLAVAISIVSFIIAPFSDIIPLVGRVGMYFSVYQLIAIPKVYSNVKNNVIRYGLLFIFCFMIMYGYFGFFQSDVYNKPYSTFHTIFSVL